MAEKVACDASWDSPDSQNAKQPHRQAGRGLLHDPSACKTPKQSCKCVPQDSLVQATESCVIFVSPNRAVAHAQAYENRAPRQSRGLLLRCAVGGWKGRLRCVLGFPPTRKTQNNPTDKPAGAIRLACKCVLVGASNRILRYFRLRACTSLRNRAPRQSHRLPLEVRSWWLERSLAMRLGIPPTRKTQNNPTDKPAGVSYTIRRLARPQSSLVSAYRKTRWCKQPNLALFSSRRTGHPDRACTSLRKPCTSSKPSTAS